MRPAGGEGRTRGHFIVTSMGVAAGSIEVYIDICMDVYKGGREGGRSCTDSRCGV